MWRRCILDIRNCGLTRGGGLLNSAWEQKFVANWRLKATSMWKKFSEKQLSFTNNATTQNWSGKDIFPSVLEKLHFAPRSAAVCLDNLTCRRVVPFRHYANDALQGMQFDWQLGLSVIQAVVDDWLASLTAATADPHCSKSLSSFLPESFKPTNWCMCYSLPHDRPNHRHLSSSEVAPAKIICKSGLQQQRNSRTVAEYHFLSYTMQLCVE